MKRNLVALGLIVSMTIWSCSKIESPQTFKQALEKNASDINTAISSISESAGYKVLTSDATPVAKDLTVGYKDSISLAKIAGIYDYQFDTVPMYHNFDHPFRLFKRTGSSEMLIVNLPNTLIFHPRYMQYLSMKDSVLKNDFTITASQYHLFYTPWNSLDYELKAGLKLQTKDLGNLEVTATATSFANQMYSSSYTFTDGYSVATKWQNGDTSKTTFVIMKDNSTLLKETTMNTSAGMMMHHGEKQYDLTIGNIEIKRGFGVDSIQVFMDGVLQKKAGAKIHDSDMSLGSIVGHRDIQLTFDDGTTTTLSSLIGSNLTDLKTLISSLHDMHFSEKVVNYIAFDIFWNSR
jgi:hypothetical protein